MTSVEQGGLLGAMPTVSEVNQLIEWAVIAAPHEACGVWLPLLPVGSNRLSMINRSDTIGRAGFTRHDLAAAVFSLAGPDSELPTDSWDWLVLWHTHPHGRVGPSDVDVKAKLTNGTRYLVLSMPGQELVEY